MISAMEKQAYPFTSTSNLEVEPQGETICMAVTEWDITTLHQSSFKLRKSQTESACIIHPTFQMRDEDP